MVCSDVKAKITLGLSHTLEYIVPNGPIVHKETCSAVK